MSEKTEIPDILRKIAETKKTEVKAKLEKIKDFQKSADKAPPALNFMNALKMHDSLAVIAEIKKASPSAGIISPDFNPVRMAECYASGPADAVSVLTDVSYFQGAPEYIKDVRGALSGIPVLCKDFIIHPVQIFEARGNGADTFLLIAEILSVKEMRDLLALGRSYGMEPLVESHSREELDKAIDAGARVFGINNRNLRDFSVNLSASEELIKFMPEGAVAVAESGIRSVEDARRLADAGFDAILVGEALMRRGPESCASVIKEFKSLRKKAR